MRVKEVNEDGTPYLLPAFQPYQESGSGPYKTASQDSAYQCPFPPKLQKSGPGTATRDGRDGNQHTQRKGEGYSTRTSDFGNKHQRAQSPQYAFQNTGPRDFGNQPKPAKTHDSQYPYHNTRRSDDRNQQNPAQTYDSQHGFGNTAIDPSSYGNQQKRARTYDSRNPFGNTIAGFRAPGSIYQGNQASTYGVPGFDAGLQAYAGPEPEQALGMDQPAMPGIGMGQPAMPGFGTDQLPMPGVGMSGQSARSNCGRAVDGATSKNQRCTELQQTVGTANNPWPSEALELDDKGWELNNFIRRPFTYYVPSGPNGQKRLVEYYNEINFADPKSILNANKARSRTIREAWKALDPNNPRQRPMQPRYRTDQIEHIKLLATDWEARHNGERIPSTQLEQLYNTQYPNEPREGEYLLKCLSRERQKDQRTR